MPSATSCSSSIDGRTVYTPLFSGVNWDSQRVMLEDVERIEVISGPGAALWGANAVNGVINVITRSAKDTQGALVARAAATGTRRWTRAWAAASGRAAITASTAWACGAKHAPGERCPGRRRLARPPARVPRRLGSGSSSFTLQGDTYRGDTDPGPAGAPKVAGSNVIARWKRELDAGGSLRLQAYFDLTERDDPFTLRDTVDTYDVELQHALAPMAGHRCSGAGDCATRSTIPDALTPFNPLAEEFVPARRSSTGATSSCRTRWRSAATSRAPGPQGGEE